MAPFVMNARVIILANTLGRNNANLEALKERGLFYRIKLTPTEIKKLLETQVKSKHTSIPLSERKKIFRKISSYCRPEVKNLNLRLFDKACRFYKHDKENWEKILDNHMELDEELVVVRDALDKFDSVKRQVNYFKRKTGRSRATFFRRKKEFLNPKR
ncbi:MAG: hypothetical protein ACOCTT_03460, partial [archaeon]